MFNHLFYFCVFTVFIICFFSICLLSGVWLVVMDCVLDRSLLHLPRAAAGPQPAAHLLCHPAGSRHDHGEEMSIQKQLQHNWTPEKRSAHCFHIIFTFGLTSMFMESDNLCCKTIWAIIWGVFCWKTLRKKERWKQSLKALYIVLAEWIFYRIFMWFTEVRILCNAM